MQHGMAMHASTMQTPTAAHNTQQYAVASGDQQYTAVAISAVTIRADDNEWPRKSIIGDKRWPALQRLTSAVTLQWHEAVQQPAIAHMHSLLEEKKRFTHQRGVFRLVACLCAKTQEEMMMDWSVNET